MAGIDMESLNKKHGKDSNEKGKYNERRKINIDPIECIKGAIKITDKVINLIEGLSKEKQKTYLEKERTKQIKIESDERIQTLKINLEENRKIMEIEFKRFEEDSKIRRKEIEQNTKVKIKELEIKKIDIENRHKQNMELINSEKRVLDYFLELHSIYYKKYINGENIESYNIEEINSIINNCINNMRTYIEALNSQNNFIEANYKIE